MKNNNIQTPPIRKTKNSSLAVAKSIKNQKSTKTTSIVTKVWTDKKQNSVAKPPISIVEIKKNIDSCGVSLVNKNDFNNDSTSHSGVTPSIFYNGKTNFIDSFDKLNVVKPYNHKMLKKSIDKASKLPNKLQAQAISKFDQDVTRAKILTNKNLEIAHVNALRILTKALIIEKNHHEQIYEKKCHQEAIKNISMLKEAKSVLNDKELSELLLMLKHDYEVELKNNETDFSRAKVKIQEMQAIHKIKRRLIRQQIKVLNQGQNLNALNSIFGRIVPLKLRKQIKKNMFIPKTVFEKDEQVNFNEISLKLKNIDIKSLSNKQQKIVARFKDLISSFYSEQAYIEKTETVIDKLNELENNAKNIKKQRINKLSNITHIDQEMNKKNLNARKESFIFIKPANMYATDSKGASQKPTNKSATSKREIIRIDDSLKMSSISTKQSLDEINKISNNLVFGKEAFAKNGVFIDPVLDKQINEIKKIQNNDYNKRKNIKCDKIECVDHRQELKKDVLEVSKSEVDNYYSVVKYQTLDVGTKGVDFNQLLSMQEKKNIQKLQKMILDLPSDPIVVENIATFKKENLDVIKMIKQFKKMTDEELLTSSQNEKIIKDIESILQIYNELSKTDSKYRQGVLKAQKLYYELSNLIKKQNLKSCNVLKKANLKYQKNKNSIDEGYYLNLDSAKNQHLLNKELILDEEQASYSKEEEIYLWNSCTQYKKSNDYMNNEYKYENRIINKVTNSIIKFNKHSDKPIGLNDIPSKILPMPINSNARIDLSIEKNGSIQYLVAHNTDQKHKLMTRYYGKIDIPKVQKIYVLDKFRAIKDVKTRVALLTEYANTEYLKAIKLNKTREAREIKMAQDKLDIKLIEIDKVYSDIELMKKANEKLTKVSNDGKNVQNMHLDAKNEQWKVHNKAMEELKKDSAASKKEVEKPSSDKRTTSNVTSDDLNGLKQLKSKERAVSLTLKLEQNDIEIIKKINRSNIQNIFKRKKDDEISIDEIIGKK